MKTCRNAARKLTFQSNPILKTLRIIGLLVGLAWLVCGCAEIPARASEQEINISDQPDPDAVTTLRGWFTIVWSDEAHFFVTDDEGRMWELSIDEAELVPLGGPLAIDRKRVEVQGTVLMEALSVFRVLSIEVLTDE
jgi:hypothetical protein